METSVKAAALLQPDQTPARHPGTLQEYVAVAINEAILGGRLKPGQRIAAEALAKDLGVSQIPVREALHALEGQGQVIRRSHRGFYVTPLSVADFQDAHLWREVLEDKAYAVACGVITKEELGRLRELYVEMGVALQHADSVLYARLNREFHMLPVRSLGSERVERFLNYLWNTCDLYFATLIGTGGAIPKLQEHHLQVIKAFEAGDAEAVNEVMRRHRTFSFDLIAPAIAPGPG
jgi:DNA-binding GntR family transcriptional regulator